MKKKKEQAGRSCGRPKRNFKIEGAADRPTRDSIFGMQNSVA